MAVLNIRVLGCGPSAGVPNVTHGWGACDPNNPRNYRLRCSLLVQKSEEGRAGAVRGVTSILVDTSPDLRTQLWESCVTWLDGVIYTHEHADHTHGIDDLRTIALSGGKVVDVYMPRQIVDTMKARFSYCFQGAKSPSHYPPILQPYSFLAGDTLTISGAGGELRVLPFEQKHGNISSFGLRFGDMAYSCDLNDLPESSLPFLENLNIWIVDALRYDPHTSHFTVEDALRWIERLRPKRAILTNLHSDLDYESLRRSLPDGVEPAFDGMTLEVDLTEDAAVVLKK